MKSSYILRYPSFPGFFVSWIVDLTQVFGMLRRYLLDRFSHRQITSTLASTKITLQNPQKAFLKSRFQAAFCSDGGPACNAYVFANWELLGFFNHQDVSRNGDAHNLLQFVVAGIPFLSPHVLMEQTHVLTKYLQIPRKHTLSHYTQNLLHNIYIYNHIYIYNMYTYRHLSYHQFFTHLPSSSSGFLEASHFASSIEVQSWCFPWWMLPNTVFQWVVIWHGKLSTKLVVF